MSFGDSMIHSSSSSTAEGFNTGLRNRRDASFLNEKIRSEKILGRSVLKDDRKRTEDEDFDIVVDQFLQSVRENPVRRAIVRRDRTITIEDLGTLARYNLRLFGIQPGFENHVDATWSAAVRKGLQSIDNGVGTLLLRMFSLYFAISICYSLILITFSTASTELGVASQGVGVIDVIIGIIFQALIFNSLWSFSGEPRSMAAAYRDLESIIEDLIFHHLNHAKRTAPDAASEARSEVEAIVQKMVNLGIMLIALYSSFASGDIHVQKYFNQQRADIKRQMAQSQHLDATLVDIIAERLDRLASQEITESSFFRRFLYNSVILTHFDLILGGYLFLIVPLQIWYSARLMINAIYPVVMHFLYTLREEEKLLGSPFMWNSGIGQSTQYVEWDRAFIKRAETLTAVTYGQLVDIHKRTGVTQSNS